MMTGEIRTEATQLNEIYLCATALTDQLDGSGPFDVTERGVLAMNIESLYGAIHQL